MRGFVVIVPAYNEERSIRQCIEGILEAAIRCDDSFYLVKILICLNGCTDNTERVVTGISDKNRLIKVIKSPKGYVTAINTLIQEVQENFPGFYIIKIDADSQPEENSFLILLEELEKHKDLIIAGGHPIPRLGKSSFGSKLLCNILYVRSIYPMSEISRKNVVQYHPYAKSNPQPKVTISWEECSKIYFHGRFWALRDAKMWILPEFQIGDDVYVAAHLINKFGKAAIRVRYDANCFFIPAHNLLHHWKTYKRIYTDIRKLKRYPELIWYINESKTKLDWQYITGLSISKITIFFLYAVIVFLEKITFPLIPYNELFWRYESKVKA